jgi:hypothetical protein
MKFKRRSDGVTCDVVKCKKPASVRAMGRWLCEKHDAEHLERADREWAKEHPDLIARAKALSEARRNGRC